MDKLNINKSKLFQERNLSDLYVGYIIYSGSQGILVGFMQHFDQLAVDRSEMAFDNQYHKTNSYKVTIITELVNVRNLRNGCYVNAHIKFQLDLNYGSGDV